MAPQITMDIDFVRQKRPTGVMGVVLVLAGVCATIGVGNAYVRQSQQLDSWESKLLDIKKMSRRTPGVIVEAPRESLEAQQEVRVANAVLRQMAVPWDALFREIETHTDDAVALLSVQPDLQNRVVRIAGEAKNLQVLVAYIRRLGAAQALSNIYLTNHEVRTQDPQRPVAFSLVAVWSEKR